MAVSWSSSCSSRAHCCCCASAASACCCSLLWCHSATARSVAARVNSELLAAAIELVTAAPFAPCCGERVRCDGLFAVLRGLALQGGDDGVVLALPAVAPAGLLLLACWLCCVTTCWRSSCTSKTASCRAAQGISCKQPACGDGVSCGSHCCSRVAMVSALDYLCYQNTHLQRVQQLKWYLAQLFSVCWQAVIWCKPKAFADLGLNVRK